MLDINGSAKNTDPLEAELCKPEMEAFRQAAIEWAKASESTRVFLILEPLNLLTDMEAQPEDYYHRMREAFENEAACREKYFKAVHALLEARRKNGNGKGNGNGYHAP